MRGSLHVKHRNARLEQSEVCQEGARRFVAEWQERGGQRLTGSTADTRPGADTSDISDPAERQPPQPHVQHRAATGPNTELDRRLTALHVRSVALARDSLCVTPAGRVTNRLSPLGATDLAVPVGKSLMLDPLGAGIGFAALFWLRRTGQLRLW